MAHKWFLVCVSVLLLSLFPLSKSLDYKDALSKTILYFESQRSGHLPFSQRATWRDHSGLTDGLEQGVDLVGGYYDAGDNIKFGLPMAFTVTMLSWSVVEYHEEIAAAGELQHALEAIKWGTDYFIKAHTHPHVLWVQVGDGETDHYCWQRPEDMTTSRRAYKIDEKHPGSDVAGETAAAMAAASIVFRTTNPHYSHLLLHHAKQLFEFGDKFRGKYDDDLKNVKGFYPSVSGYKDELLWAGLWLYKATRKMEYMDYVIQNAHSFGGITWAMQEFSWDVKYAGVQVMASMLHRDKHDETLNKYREKAEHYICSCLNKTKHTPGGLLFTRKWNNLQYVSNAAFLLTVYSDHLKSTNQNIICHNNVTIGADDVFNFAKSQVDYILGLNPINISYLVGYGTKYPKRVHHRGASIISYKSNKAFIGCMQGYRGWFGRRRANPNVLTGAVVGGPDDHDRFTDVRANYMQTEACTYNAAPLVGTLGKLAGPGGSMRRITFGN
ncbi:endoglucanase 11-like [Bidens hawaiensis]|uniref:endoglucanase 11-like n=1 Tax=Bidens hawaiensis TaxID=980011 RepID=UPI00404B7A42